MQPPNIFSFATSELSQDAFICWLASWGEPALKSQNEALHATATVFLDRLLEVGMGPKVSEYRSIAIERQDNRIDVLLVVNGDIAIIIEDKTNTKDHSDQLPRYKKVLAAKFPENRIAAIYLKTGDQCDYGNAEQAGYGCFLRRDFLDILERGKALGITSDIFTDFCRYLQGIEEAVQSFSTVQVRHWKPPQWKGFFMVLKQKLGDGDWDNRGHGGGGSLTFRWYCQPDKYLGLHEDELGFRIEVRDESQREAKWSEWNRMLLAKNDTTGIRIKPSRFRPGMRMKVAVLEGDYRRLQPDGRLDLDRTVETIRMAKALIDAALQGWEWREGKVDPNTPHMKLFFGDSALAVALVAKPVGNTFVVEFLQVPELGQKEHQQIKLAVTKELTFYLVEKGEQDPWQYAIYHCGTASNLYSDVHWGYFPRGTE
jgi:PD-(D/E)XK nuclease superfamily